MYHLTTSDTLRPYMLNMVGVSGTALSPQKCKSTKLKLHIYCLNLFGVTYFVTCKMISVPSAIGCSQVYLLDIYLWNLFSWGLSTHYQHSLATGTSSALLIAHRVCTEGQPSPSERKDTPRGGAFAGESGGRDCDKSALIMPTTLSLCGMHRQHIKVLMIPSVSALSA